MSEPPSVCDSCSAPLPADAGFCPTCGAPTPTRLHDADPAGKAASEFEDRLRQALGDAYELRELIGRGGFGVVYAAWDRTLEREVAVKALRFDLFPTEQLLERFQREARAVARLRHPNIVPIYSVGEGAGVTYMVMPRIRGESLRALLGREGRLGLGEAVRIARDVASALEAAHREGIVHRDVKPENILLEGDERRVLLSDFGIAKQLGGRGGTPARLTGASVILGTPGYLSPEQIDRRPGIDRRSDIYSLGCVLYEMLAGDPPFTGSSVETVLAKHLTGEPIPLHVLRPNVPEGVSSTVQRALRKVAGDRFSTAQDFRSALEPTPSSSRARMPRLPFPSLKMVGWAGLAVSGVVLMMWVSSVEPDESVSDTPPALRARMNLGLEAYYSNQPRLAAELLEIALRGDRRDEERRRALRYLARSALESADTSLARSALRELLETEPPLALMLPSIETESLMQLYYDVRRERLRDQAVEGTDEPMENLSVFDFRVLAADPSLVDAGNFDELGSSVAEMVMSDLRAEGVPASVFVEELSFGGRGYEAYPLLEHRILGDGEEVPTHLLIGSVALREVGVLLSAWVFEVRSGALVRAEQASGPLQDFLHLPSQLARELSGGATP